jgi:hypothetical protein
MPSSNDYCGSLRPLDVGARLKDWSVNTVIKTKKIRLRRKYASICTLLRTNSY